MTDRNVTLNCVHCGAPYQHKLTLDGKPRKRKYEGSCVKCSQGFYRKNSYAPAPWPSEHRTCVGCGTAFEALTATSVYCTKACCRRTKRARQKVSNPTYYESRRSRDSKRRALKRTTQVEKINPLEVFERDGWICHICKEPTSRSRGRDARNNDPKFAELEHVVALSDGGTHTWQNVACACRSCNCRKQASSFGQLHLDYGPKRTWPELATPNQPARLMAC